MVSVSTVFSVLHDIIVVMLSVCICSNTLTIINVGATLLLPYKNMGVVMLPVFLIFVSQHQNAKPFLPYRIGGCHTHLPYRNGL